MLNKCAKFHGDKLISILRERLNFWRRPILCTTLYRNPIQASNFGDTFDQLFLWICLCNFHTRCPSPFSIPSWKRVKNDQKLKSSALNVADCSQYYLLYSFIPQQFSAKWLCKGKSLWIRLHGPKLKQLPGCQTYTENSSYDCVLFTPTYSLSEWGVRTKTDTGEVQCQPEGADGTHTPSLHQSWATSLESWRCQRE